MLTVAGYGGEKFDLNLNFRKKKMVTGRGTGARAHGHGRHGRRAQRAGHSRAFFQKNGSGPFNARAHVPVDARGTGRGRGGTGRTRPRGHLPNSTVRIDNLNFKNNDKDEI